MEEMAIRALTTSGTPDFDEAYPATEKAERSNEQRLIDALDQAALRFSKILLDDSKDEAGNHVISWGMRVEVFKMVRDWVATRRRTDISDPEGDQSGIQEMQRRVETAQAAAREQRAPELDPKTGLPKRERGRPTKEQTAEFEALARKRDEALARKARNDDSGMMAALAKAQRNGGAP